MGDPVSIAAVASVASLGMSAYGTIKKGEGDQAAADFKADKAEEAARFGREQAELTDVTLRERLNTTLANIDSIRAAAHVDPTSPTTVAVEDWQRQLSNRQRSAAAVSAQAQASSDEASARYLRQAGDYALGQAELGAAVGVAGGLAKGFGKGGSFSLGG